MGNNNLETKGYPSIAELNNTPGFPLLEDLERKPLAVIECIQEIPCNPCEDACPFGAIKVGHPITNLPILDSDKCTACGKCIASCPGLAIFRVEIKDEEAYISFPYEYDPLPIKGDKVPCGDREGKFVAYGIVIKITLSKTQDKTPIIQVMVPKEYAQVIRTLVRGEIHG